MTKDEPRLELEIANPRFAGATLQMVARIRFATGQMPGIAGNRVGVAQRTCRRRPVPAMHAISQDNPAHMPRTPLYDGRNRRQPDVGLVSTQRSITAVQ